MRQITLFFLFTILIQLTGSAQVSNNMTLHTQWNPADIPNQSGVKFNDLWGYVDESGREYAIVGSAQFIHVLEVTDPSNVVEIDQIAPGGSTVWRDFKTYGNRIYGVSDNAGEGLVIMDASYLPDSVHVTYQANEFFTMCHNIFIDETHGRLYAAGTDVRSNGLIVLDLVADPDSPQLMVSSDLSGEYVHDLYVNDHIVYASHGWNGLYIWNYEDPSAIQLLANIRTNGYNHSSWLTDDYKYLIYAEEIPAGVDMGVVDVTNLWNGEIEITKLFKFPLLAPAFTNVTPHNPYIRDTILVVSYYLDGTQIFDIGDATDPKPYAFYDTEINSTYNSGGGNWGTYPFLPSGTIISSDIRNGLFVMSMDDYDMAGISYNPTFPETMLAPEPGFDPCSEAPLRLETPGNYQYYQWFKDGVIIPNETSNTIIVSEDGEYQAVGLQGQKRISSNTYAYERNSKPTVTQINDQLTASSETGLLNWYVNGREIGESSTSVTPSFDGYYQVERTNDLGCKSVSDSIYYFLPRPLSIESLNGLNVRYNNNENLIEVNLESDTPINLKFRIIDAIGRVLYRNELAFDGFSRNTIINQNWTTGIYFISIDDGSNQETFKIFIP